MGLVGGSVGVSHTLIHAPLYTVQATRYLAAAVLLWSLAKSVKQPIVRPRGREWAWLAGVAATGLVVFNVAIVRGVAHAEPAVIAVAVACVPIVLGLIGPLLEGRTPAGRIVLAGFVVTAGGVLVLGAGETDAQGIGWAVLALACEAGFTLLAVPVLPRHGAVGVSVHSVWLGAAMFSVLAVADEGVTAVRGLTASDWAAIGYLAVLVTAVAFVLWYSAVSALGAGRAGLLTGIAPVSAALSGVLVGADAPDALLWVGIGIVVSGLVLGLRPRAERAVTNAATASYPEACPLQPAGIRQTA
jgi:drug/metabolite transporter (DMT)-like permease